MGAEGLDKGGDLRGRSLPWSEWSQSFVVRVWCGGIWEGLDVRGLEGKTWIVREISALRNFYPLVRKENLLDLFTL